MILDRMTDKKEIKLIYKFNVVPVQIPKGFCFVLFFWDEREE